MIIGIVLNLLFFFNAIFASINSDPFILAIFIKKFKAQLKVKAFAWLVANKKINTNVLLQWKRSYKVLNPELCVMCKRSGESKYHIFLHCLAALENFELLIYTELSLEYS